MRNKLIKNNRGQALFEAVLMVPITILFFIYIIEILLYLTVEIAVDDAMESSLLCQIQQSENCKIRFQQTLDQLPLSKINYRFTQNGALYEVEIEARALRIFHIKKERRINYDTKI